MIVRNHLKQFKKNEWLEKMIKMSFVRFLKKPLDWTTTRVTEIIDEVLDDQEEIDEPEEDFKEANPAKEEDDEVFVSPSKDSCCMTLILILIHILILV